MRSNARSLLYRFCHCLARGAAFSAFISSLLFHAACITSCTKRTGQPITHPSTLRTGMGIHRSTPRRVGFLLSLIQDSTPSIPQWPSSRAYIGHLEANVNKRLSKRLASASFGNPQFLFCNTCFFLPFSGLSLLARSFRYSPVFLHAVVEQSPPCRTQARELSQSPRPVWRG